MRYLLVYPKNYVGRRQERSPVPIVKTMWTESAAQASPTACKPANFSLSWPEESFYFLPESRRGIKNIVFGKLA